MVQKLTGAKQYMRANRAALRARDQVQLLTVLSAGQGRREHRQQIATGAGGLRTAVGKALLAALCIGSASPLAAQSYDARATALTSDAKFGAATASLDGDYDRIIADLITLTQIEAPPFKEDARARAYMEMLRAVGLSDVHMDEEGNVMGLRKGTGGGPLIAVAAHLDTVFPEGTDVTVRREGNVLHAPGIGDATSSLPVLLAYVRAMDAAGYQTRSDILFIGNVGEEGPGDLRGTRYLFNESPLKDTIKYFISFEPGRAGRITNGGVGSKRYKVTFSGPGGHSFGAFGTVSPAFAMADAIAQFGNIEVPQSPKTTYNVGLVEGGTSVNSIPFAMSMTVDMRSEDKAELEKVEKAFLSILPEAVARENAARSTGVGEISYEAEPVGDRPVGLTPLSADIVQIATAAAKSLGFEARYGRSSTDSNIPMSLGIPAVTLGSGFATARAHSLDESLTMDRASDVPNMASGLATLLLLAEAH